MTPVQIMQLALALLTSLQQALAGGILDPDEPIELTQLGSEHAAALEELKKALEGH